MEYLVTFPEASTAQKVRLASDLSNSLIGFRSVSASPRREHADAQDTGTLVAIVFASPVIQEVVKHLFAWITRNHASIVIEIPEKKARVKISNADDIAKVMQSLKELG